MTGRVTVSAVHQKPTATPSHCCTSIGRLLDQLHVGTDCMARFGVGAFDAGVGVFHAVLAHQALPVGAGKCSLPVDASPRGVVSGDPCDLCLGSI